MALLSAPDRNVNYDMKQLSREVGAFVDFTYNQIEELMTDYGQMDILWLDGGWVRPPAHPGNLAAGPAYEQDIDMPRSPRWPAASSRA